MHMTRLTLWLAILLVPTIALAASLPPPVPLLSNGPSPVRPPVRPPAAAPAIPAPAGPARKPAPPHHQALAHRPVTAKPAPPRPVAPVVPLAPPEPEPPAAPTKGTNSGLVLPRFASLRSDEVFMRAGPGPRYPVDWVYKRRDYPVEIEREFDIWRLVRDVEGVRGWVNTQTLAPRRSGVVLPGPNGAIPIERTLRKEARDDSPAVARLKPGVVVRLRSCDAGSDWCAAQIQDYRGYVRRTDVWGVYPGEAVQ